LEKNQEFVFKWTYRADIIFHLRAHFVTLLVSISSHLVNK